jgi:hypothetical protein
MYAAITEAVVVALLKKENAKRTGGSMKVDIVSGIVIRAVPCVCISIISNAGGSPGWGLGTGVSLLVKKTVWFEPITVTDVPKRRAMGRCDLRIGSDKKFTLVPAGTVPDNIFALIAIPNHLP